MTCFSPMKMYWTGNYTDNGKKEYTFVASKGYADVSVEVPCGKCLGCIQDRRRDMSMRMNDEASMYERNCFITLTVDEEHMEEVFPDRNLSKRPFQLFMKRLRKECKGDYYPRPSWYTGKNWNAYPIRAVYCGEYGETFGRPHYHAVLFNFDFADKKLLYNGDNPLYTSEQLQSLWPYGFSTIGEVTFGSCAYVCGYVLKKTNRLEDYVDKQTGLIREPEFIVFPRGFGLGRPWYEKNHKYVFNYDRRVLRGGVFVRPSKYYDKLFDGQRPEDMADLKKKRFARSLDSMGKPRHLAAKEEILAAKLKKAKEKRNVE